MLTGVYKPTAGKIVFDGVDVSDKPPHAITELGIGRTFQNIRLFQHMTALENVLVGMHSPAQGRDPRLDPPDAARAARGAGGDETAARELLLFSGLRGRDGECRGTSPTATSAASRSRARSRRSRSCSSSTSRPPG